MLKARLSRFLVMLALITGISSVASAQCSGCNIKYIAYQGFWLQQAIPFCSVDVTLGPGSANGVCAGTPCTATSGCSFGSVTFTLTAHDTGGKKVYVWDVPPGTDPHHVLADGEQGTCIVGDAAHPVAMECGTNLVADLLRVVLGTDTWFISLRCTGCPENHGY